MITFFDKESIDYSGIITVKEFKNNTPVSYQVVDLADNSKRLLP